jgi:hypothetical protein
MMNTRRTNLSQNNTHEEAESIGSEARIANLNQQLAQAQKNVENLLAQNVVLQAAPIVCTIATPGRGRE